jgi:NAD(P)H-hydrate repair Nnr-like enzyme with NAD(P)H-hydrate epimerase domain
MLIEHKKARTVTHGAPSGMSVSSGTVVQGAAHRHYTVGLSKRHNSCILSPQAQEVEMLN